MMKAGSNYLQTTEEDEDLASASVAAANKISMEAAVAGVLSALDVSCFKEDRRTAQKAFLFSCNVALVSGVAPLHQLDASSCC